MRIILFVSALLMLGCAAAPEKAPSRWAGYPITTHNGKKYYRIPAEDYLLSKEVPVPVAPSPDGVSIRINLSNQRAWLYMDGALYLTSAICPGKPGFETPPGDYKIISKHEKWVSTIYHVPMPYFLRFCAGTIGLHEGAIALSPASHGCIRLPKGYAQAFFEATPVGAKVVVDTN